MPVKQREQIERKNRILAGAGSGGGGRAEKAVRLRRRSDQIHSGEANSTSAETGDPTLSEKGVGGDVGSPGLSPPVIAAASEISTSFRQLRELLIIPDVAYGAQQQQRAVQQQPPEKLEKQKDSVPTIEEAAVARREENPVAPKVTEKEIPDRSADSVLSEIAKGSMPASRDQHREESHEAFRCDSQGENFLPPPKTGDGNGPPPAGHGDRGGTGGGGGTRPPEEARSNIASGPDHHETTVSNGGMTSSQEVFDRLKDAQPHPQFELQSSSSDPSELVTPPQSQSGLNGSFSSREDLEKFLDEQLVGVDPEKIIFEDVHSPVVGRRGSSENESQKTESSMIGADHDFASPEECNAFLDKQKSFFQTGITRKRKKKPATSKQRRRILDQFDLDLQAILDNKHGLVFFPRPRSKERARRRAVPKRGERSGPGESEREMSISGTWEEQNTFNLEKSRGPSSRERSAAKESTKEELNASLIEQMTKEELNEFLDVLSLNPRELDDSLGFRESTLDAPSSSYEEYHSVSDLDRLLDETTEAALDAELERGRTTEAALDAELERGGRRAGCGAGER